MTTNNKANTAKKPFLKPFIIVLSAVIIILAAVLIFSASKYSSNTILSGVKCADMDLSGLTPDEAITILKERAEKAKDIIVDIDAGGDKFSSSLSELGASYNYLETAKNAYSYGHDSFMSSIMPALKSLFGYHAEIPYVIDINDRVFVDKMSENTDFDKSVEATYVLGLNAICVTNGKPAYTINPVSARNALKQVMQDMSFSEIVLTKENIQPIPFDIDEAMASFSDEASSATYVRNEDGTISVTPGYDKVIVDINDARKIIAGNVTPSQTYKIPAEIEFAAHTSEELEEALFRDTLSSYTTSFATSDANRSSNVALAAKSINDIILMPGESFSYNNALGKRTPEAGYKLAGAYSNGESVQEYGGGICQISSMLYNTVLLANLQVDERLCHMFTVSYVPLGRDATVDYGTVDFAFTNNTEYPIKIVAYTTPAKQAVIEIVGTKTENFEVTMETTGISYIPFETVTEEVPDLAPGEEKVVEQGSNGIRCSTYRVVKVDGVEVSRTFESSSYYMPHKRVVQVGIALPEDAAPPASSESIEEFVPATENSDVFQEDETPSDLVTEEMPSLPTEEENTAEEIPAVSDDVLVSDNTESTPTPDVPGEEASEESEEI